MTRTIPISEARKDLSDLLNAVAFGGQKIVLTRHNKPVAILMPPLPVRRSRKK